MRKTAIILAICLLIAIAAAFQTHTFPALDTDNVFTGSNTFKNMGTLRFAEAFTGTDCGAKIAGADTALGGLAGVIIVNANCGTTWTTWTSPAANHIVMLTPGTYTSSVAITFTNANSGMSGFPNEVGSNTVLRQANTSNIANFVTISGANAFLRNLTVDCNKAANTGTACVLQTGVRSGVTDVTVSNAPAIGLSLNGGSGNDTITKLLVQHSGTDGIFCGGGQGNVYTSDVVVYDSGGNGIHISDCPGFQLNTGNIGLSALDGMLVTGTAAIGSGQLNVTNTQFGDSSQNSLELIGTDGSGSCGGTLGAVIVGNVFLGSGNVADATYDQVKATDQCQATITGNFMMSPGGAGHRYKNGIELLETGAGRSVNNNFGSNTFFGSFSGKVYTNTTTVGSAGLILGNAAFISSYDSTNLLKPIMQMFTDNIVYLVGHPTPKEIILQPNPGVTTADFKDTGTLFNVGIGGNGSGFKHKRGTAGCATAASVGAACTTVVTWTTPFVDASYTAVCTGDLVTSGIPVSGGLTAKAAASVTFQTVATTAAAAQYTNVECSAVHD